jgi:hypothetical protein
MNAIVLYRIAAVLLLLFAVGHTFGFLAFKPPTPEGLAVHNAMNDVKFEFKGASYSYGGLYRGFGLTVTAYLLFSAVLAWHLSVIAGSSPKSIGMLAWAFAGVQLACLVLSLLYFFLVPALFSGVVVIVLAWAAWLLRDGAISP